MCPLGPSTIELLDVLTHNCDGNAASVVITIAMMIIIPISLQLTSLRKFLQIFFYFKKIIKIKKKKERNPTTKTPPHAQNKALINLL